MQDTMTEITIPENTSAKIMLPSEASHTERLFYAAIMGRFQAPAKGLDLFFDQVIHMKGCIYGRSEWIDKKTGEVGKGTRIIFLMEDESCVSSFSPVALKWVQEALIPLFTVDGKPGMLTGVVPVLVGKQPVQGQKNPTYALQFVQEGV